jgi:hypothetical protein
VRELLKTLAAICALIFIFTGVLSLILFNIESRAFSSTTYKQAFTDQRLYERMPGILAATLSTSISQNQNMVPFLRELTVEEWQAMISTFLPPEELRAMTDQTLDATFDYLNFHSNSVIISILPVKARLAGEAGVNVVRQFLQTQPACTVEQLTQMALGLLGGEIALCNPPEEAMSLLAPFIQSQLQTINATFPNEIALVPGTESGTPLDPRLQLQAIRSAVRFSPFFVLLLLLTVAVLAVHSLRDLLIWWGWPLLITGMASAVIAIIGSPIVGWFLQLLIRSQGAILLPPILASSIGETATAVASQMLVPVILQGFIIAGIGLVMVVLGIMLGRRQRYIITYT